MEPRVGSSGEILTCLKERFKKKTILHQMHITIGNLISMLVIKPKLWTSGTVYLSSKFESPKKDRMSNSFQSKCIYVLPRTNQDQGSLVTTYI